MRKMICQRMLWSLSIRQGAYLSRFSNAFSTVAEKDFLLPSKRDHFNGVIVQSAHLPPLVDDFVISLKYSLKVWKEDGRRGVWMKIPLDKSDLIPASVSTGFVFHHAEAGYVMMVQWLPLSNSELPPNASHQVGVGCVVAQNGKLLCVQERRGVLRGTGVWKIPTGLLDAGEDLESAAEREVLEETGVSTSFKGVLGIKHQHRALFGKSDMFFICLLEAKTTNLTKCDKEIVAVEWQDIHSYVQQKRFSESPVWSKVNELIMQAVCAPDPTKGSLCSSSFAPANYYDSNTPKVALLHPPHTL